MYSYFHSADFFEINRAHCGMLTGVRDSGRVEGGVGKGELATVSSRWRKSLYCWGEVREGNPGLSRLSEGD